MAENTSTWQSGVQIYVRTEDKMLVPIVWFGTHFIQMLDCVDKIGIIRLSSASAVLLPGEPGIIQILRYLPDVFGAVVGFIYEVPIGF